MSEPNTSAVALSGVAASSLAVLFPQYLWIVGGALIGAIYALFGAQQMTRPAAVRYLVRAMLPALIFSHYAAQQVNSRYSVDLRDAFSIVAFLIAIAHEQGIKLVKDAFVAALRVVLRVRP